MQACTSKAAPLHHGDITIAIYARGFQEEPGFGVSWQHKVDAFSDVHDVVAAPVRWDRKLAGSSAAQPASSKSPRPADTASWSSKGKQKAINDSLLNTWAQSQAGLCNLLHHKTASWKVVANLPSTILASWPQTKHALPYIKSIASRPSCGHKRCMLWA